MLVQAARAAPVVDASFFLHDSREHNCVVARPLAVAPMGCDPSSLGLSPSASWGRTDSAHGPWA